MTLTNTSVEGQIFGHFFRWQKRNTCETHHMAAARSAASCFALCAGGALIAREKTIQAKRCPPTRKRKKNIAQGFSGLLGPNPPPKRPENLVLVFCRVLSRDIPKTVLDSESCIQDARATSVVTSIDEDWGQGRETPELGDKRLLSFPAFLCSRAERRQTLGIKQIMQKTKTLLFFFASPDLGNKRLFCFSFGRS